MLILLRLLLECSLECTRFVTVAPSSFAFECFNLFFSVCCFSSPRIVATSFFFIEADLENDGLGEILGNVIILSFCSYLDIFFVSGLE